MPDACLSGDAERQKKTGDDRGKVAYGLLFFGDDIEEELREYGGADTDENSNECSPSKQNDACYGCGKQCDDNVSHYALSRGRGSNVGRG